MCENGSENNDRENDAGIGLERERERESKLTASLIEHD